MIIFHFQYLTYNKTIYIPKGNKILKSWNYKYILTNIFLGIKKYFWTSWNHESIINLLENIDYVIMFLCFYVFMFYVFMFLCYYVFMFLCFYVFMFLCFYVFMFLCFDVFMFLCFYVFMFLCFYVLCFYYLSLKVPST